MGDDPGAPAGYDTKLLLSQMIPNNPVVQRDAPAVQKDILLSALVTMHDATDVKTMQRAESLKRVLGADFKGKINEVLLESSPALQSRVSNSPIKVVDRGDGRHVVADGNGRVQAMKLAFVDHSAVNVAADEVELGHKEKKGTAAVMSKPSYTELPYQRDQLPDRKALFDYCDSQRNHYLSMDEVDKGLFEKYSYGDKSVDGVKQCMVQAFDEAKNYGGDQKGAAADFVEHREFRIFLELFVKKLDGVSRPQAR